MFDRYERLIRFVDVGALGGLQQKWLPHIDKLWPILFEPNSQEAGKLKASAGIYSKCTVIQAALSNVDGEDTLFVTKNPSCTSLHRPNTDFLASYPIRVHFEVIQQETISCSRYDTLYSEESVPQPDLIKLDVQGHEYEVLMGFGGLLDHCFGIELEAHFYPLYCGQKLLYEIIQFLRSYNMVLRKIDTNKLQNFDGDLVEVDAYFTKTAQSSGVYNDVERAKLELITKVWGLVPPKRTTSLHL